VSHEAFEAARADGVIDTFLAMPAPRAEQAKKYDHIRAIANDAETQSMEMPAQYMFKDVPHYDELDDSVVEVLRLMDKHNIMMMVPGLQEGPGKRACVEHPDRFRGMTNVDPNQGMDAVRALERAVRDEGAIAAHTWGAGLNPQVPNDDKKMYPIYAKCVELDIPICVNGGIVGPRMPSWPQKVERFDEVCYDFPDLTIVIMHGAEPWTELAVKLMLKWPGLHYMTSAFAPKHYPKAIINYANTRGADKIMYCGYFPAGLSLERQFTDMPNVPFKDEVWPKFLRENAMRVFKLPPAGA